MGHLLRVGLLTVAAVVVAVCGTFVHPATVNPAGLPVPYGLLLALLMLAVLMLLAQLAARSRIGKGVIAAGWLIPVILLSRTTPAGDVVIAGDALGLGYLFGGVVLIGVAVGLPSRHLGRPEGQWRDRDGNSGADGRVG